MNEITEEKQIAKVSDFEVVAFTECLKISLIEARKSPKTIESYIGDVVVLEDDDLIEVINKYK